MRRTNALIVSVLTIAFATHCCLPIVCHAQTAAISAREIWVKKDLLGRVGFLGFDGGNNVIEQRNNDPEHPDTGIRSWDIKSGKPNWLIPDDSDLSVAMRLSPNGKILVSCKKKYPKAPNAVKSPTSDLSLFRTSDGEHVYLINREHHIDNFAFDAKGVGFVFHQFTIRNEFQFWSVDKDGGLQPRELLINRADRLYDNAYAMFQGSFSPDLTRLAAPVLVRGAIPLKFLLRQWDIRKEKILWTTKEPMSFVCGPSYSSSGKWIVGSLSDNTTRIWDAETGKELEKIVHAGNQKEPKYYCHAISPDSKWLATASEAKPSEVTLWEMPTAKKLLTIPLHQESVTAVAFNQRGDLLAAGSLNALHVWELSVPKSDKMK